MCTRGPSKCMIIAVMVLALPWTVLFSVVCNSKHDALQDHQNLWLWLAQSLHSNGGCYWKSFAKVSMTHAGTIKIYNYSWDGAYIVMNDAIFNRLQKYEGPIPGLSNSMIIAEAVLKLSWTMPFEIVCKSMHDPLQDHTNRRLQLRWCSHCHGRYCLESFAKAAITHSRTMEIWDCSRDGVHIVCTMLLKVEIVCDTWHEPLQDPWHSWLELGWSLLCHGRGYLKSFAIVGMIHCRTIEIYDYAGGGVYMIRYDAILNCLQKYAWATPEPSKSMIVAEAVLEFSWTILSEIVCSSTHDPLQGHQNLWL